MGRPPNGVLGDDVGVPLVEEVRVSGQGGGVAQRRQGGQSLCHVISQLQAVQRQCDTLQRQVTSDLSVVLGCGLRKRGFCHVAVLHPSAEQAQEAELDADAGSLGPGPRGVVNHHPRINSFSVLRAAHGEGVLRQNIAQEVFLSPCLQRKHGASIPEDVPRSGRVLGIEVPPEWHVENFRGRINFACIEKAVRCDPRFSAEVQGDLRMSPAEAARKPAAAAPAL